jgi:hypothetical protein
MGRKHKRCRDDVGEESNIVGIKTDRKRLESIGNGGRLLVIVRWKWRETVGYSELGMEGDCWL